MPQDSNRPWYEAIRCPYHAKDANHVSKMMLWAWAGVPLGVYTIVGQFNVALQIQPQMLAFLSLVTWIQCYYYEHKWSVTKALAVVLPIGSAMAGIEVGLIFALRKSKKRGVEWPVTLMAVLAALFLASGVLRHYWDIYRHRTVRGISFFFVGLDAMGDLTSISSVLFQPSLDVLGLIIYGVELTLWIGIFACGGYYNLRPWLRAKMNIQRSEDQPVSPGLALHDLPSSTSVFRTPSRYSNELRSRNTTAAGELPT
jgi:type III secretory pathway component EscS